MSEPTLLELIETLREECQRDLEIDEQGNVTASGPGERLADALTTAVEALERNYSEGVPVKPAIDKITAQMSGKGGADARVP